jgi:acetyl esterase/lipase
MSVKTTIVYRRVDGLGLSMDLHGVRLEGRQVRPGRRRPALLWIHGGGWSEGDRTGLLPGFDRLGCVLASIDYRLFPVHRFPAMIEDVKAAIRFLRARAVDFGIDPDRIALAGHSAGGHLAALAALAGPEAGWEVGEDLGVSSAVAAVVTLSGFGDLMRPLPKGTASHLPLVFSAEEKEKGSPVRYASRGAPPFLIIHGEADPVVTVEQARILREALVAHRAEAETLLVRNAGHGFEAVGGRLSPGVLGIFARTAFFLSGRLERGLPFRRFRVLGRILSLLLSLMRTKA